MAFPHPPTVVLSSSYIDTGYSYFTTLELECDYCGNPEPKYRCITCGRILCKDHKRFPSEAMEQMAGHIQSQYHNVKLLEKSRKNDIIDIRETQKKYLNWTSKYNLGLNK